MLERLQKTIARAGIASRRHAELLILSGQVQVNGRIVSELGAKADPERDVIKVAGKALRFPERKLYLVVHKPARCVSAMSDPERRKTLQNCLHGVAGRVFPVGRLEYHASGLILLTNDGELANRVLEASRHGLEQTYWLKLARPLREEERRDLVARTRARIRLVRSGRSPWYEVALTEPRRDLLRKRLLKLGHPVEKVKRVGLANLELGRLVAGEYRYLEAKEVQALERAVEKALVHAGPDRHQRARPVEPFGGRERSGSPPAKSRASGASRGILSERSEPKGPERSESRDPGPP